MRAVIEYPNCQRGSTKHWDPGTTVYRPAETAEHAQPLGARLAEHNEKMVWIEVHVEIEPEDDPADIIEHHEQEAVTAFQEHRPGHTIMR